MGRPAGLGNNLSEDRETAELTGIINAWKGVQMLSVRESLLGSIRPKV